MEVICLESKALYELIEQVVARIKETSSAPADKWISPEKAMGLLNISSKTTLQKFRDEGKIRFSQPEKRIILYDSESINAYLESKAKNTF